MRGGSRSTASPVKTCRAAIGAARSLRTVWNGDNWWIALRRLSADPITIADVAHEGRLEVASCIMPATTNIRRREGDLLKIDLGDDRNSYAQVATEPLSVFFDGSFTHDLPLVQIASLPVLFRIRVANYAIKHGRWAVVGRAVLAPEDQEEPFFINRTRSLDT